MLNMVLQLTFFKGHMQLQSLGSNYVKYGVTTYIL